ncbi:hypothetical protein Gogos_016599 [Gossypium gossypioides]|uniref:DUF4283 domain-containing protein n=1 Tax=Gossypium gossypioides TaxID=34282 RepID=A0A7J9B8K9_GOSGO|nr:hypothetical protein [Gossypium gossypioides]
MSCYILDLENNYLSVHFQDDNEYLAMISRGSWMIFGHYLIEGMQNTSLLNFIGGVIGPIAKIDRNTDSKVRGKFARLAVFVDLRLPLISNIKIDDQIQCVEYESLSMDTTSMMDVDQLPMETSGVPKCVEEERGTVVGERNGSRFESLSGNLGDNPGDFRQEINGIFFQVSSPRLDGGNHVAVTCPSSKGKELIGDSGKNNHRSKLEIRMGESSCHRSNRLVGGEARENTSQIPCSLSAYEEPSLTVMTVMNESIHGMRSHNGENFRLMDDEVEDDGSSDESLADAEEA